MHTLTNSKAGFVEIKGCQTKLNGGPEGWAPKKIIKLCTINKRCQL